MVDRTLEPIQRSGVKKQCREGHSTYEPSWGRRETPYKLGPSTHCLFELEWMSCDSSSDMLNSGRIRRKFKR